MSSKSFVMECFVHPGALSLGSSVACRMCLCWDLCAHFQTIPRSSVNETNIETKTEASILGKSGEYKMILAVQNDLMGKVKVAAHVLMLLFLPISKYKEETLNCSNNGNPVTLKWWSKPLMKKI